MDPMPSTDTTAIGTGWHVRGNLELRADRPNTLMVDTENGQVLGLDAVHIRGVRNGEGTTLHVVNAL